LIYEVTIGDTTHKVELRQTPEGLVCRVDGEEFHPDIAHAERDVLSLVLGGRSLDVVRQQSPQGTTVSFDKSVYEVEVRDPRSFRARKRAGLGEAGPMAIKAPMPGKVVRILAAEGNEVTAGQGVIVIEAMKMQNELKSPKAGKVQKILIAEGAAVNAGDALAVVE
jgi:biotin carboxyl carrier protein